MTTVYVRTEKYSISGINIPSTFKPGEESVIKIAIKKYDGTPVLDSKNPVTLNALRSSYTEYQESAEKEILKFEGFLNETGSVEFTFIFPYKDNTITEYYLKAKYDDTESWVGHTYFSFESTSTESINLSVKTRNPSIYKDLLVSLSSCKYIGPFVYFIMNNGVIVKTERITPAERTSKYTFQIKPTFQMIPNSRIFVTLYNEGDLIVEDLLVDFERDLMNQIEIETSEDARPGQEINLQIKTTESSFVGLLGIDQSILLSQEQQHFEAPVILDNITNTCRSYGKHLLTITNADLKDSKYNTIYILNIVNSLRNFDKFQLAKRCSYFSV